MNIEATKVSNCLVRAKLHPLQGKEGSSKYRKRRYEVCNNVTGATIFSSAVSGDIFKINHSLNYDVKCFMYLMTCKQYNNTRKKLQFSFVIDGITITRIMLKILIGKSHVCKNTSKKNFAGRVTKAF